MTDLLIKYSNFFFEVQWSCDGFIACEFIVVGKVVKIAI